MTFEIEQQVRDSTRNCLDSYRVNPDLVDEHYGIEQSVAESGYDRRQIFELVQNGADAILEENPDDGAVRRIDVVLTSTHLYCANQGRPIDRDGVKAILGSYRSRKRGNEIGRFGVGFKSVLGVTNVPEFFSTSGSFHFDPRESRRQIRDVAPNEMRLPVLRLAFPTDLSIARQKDPVLDALFEWATTVVRLRLKTGTDWLDDHLGTFPPEFLLFSAHVTHLTLDNRRSKSCRTISARRRGSKVDLTVGDTTHQWHVFRKNVPLPKPLRERAGELQDRAVLPLSWAVPTSRSTTRGRFWAFFPMENDTTLRGILNAPWKTNSDRQTVLEGELNKHLITNAAELVLDSLPALQTDEDPCAFLDYLPARGREASTWADSQLTAEVWDLAQYAPTLPDQLGALREPKEIRLHPDGIPRAALDYWAGNPERPTEWLHHGVDGSRDRRARVDYIRRAAGLSFETVDDWLAAPLALNPTSSIHAIHVAASLLDADTFDEGSWREVPIVLTADGRLSPPDPNVVAIASSYTPGKHVRRKFVHPDLVAAAETREALERLGIHPLTVDVELRGVLAQPLDLDDGGWRHLWSMLARLDLKAALHILRESESSSSLHARAMSGDWVRLTSLLIPGPVVSPDGRADARATLDVDFHADTFGLLEALGLGRRPVYHTRTPDGVLWREYLNEQRRAFLQGPLARNRNPSVNLIRPSPTGWVGPLDVLPRLSPDARFNYSLETLNEHERLTRWTFAHNNDSYGKLHAPNPTIWALGRYGLFATSRGRQPVERCVHPALHELGDVLPVADIPTDIADQLQLPDEIRLIDHELKEWVLEQAAMDRRLMGKWLAAVARSELELPSRIPVIDPTSGEAATAGLGDVLVAGDDDDLETLAESGVPFILAPRRDDVDVLVEAGLTRATTSVNHEYEAFRAQAPIPIKHIFPDLAFDPAFDELQVIRCEALTRHTHTTAGSRRQPVEDGIEDGTIYVPEDADPGRIVSLAFRAVDEELPEDRHRSLIANAKRKAGTSREAAVRAEDGLDAKLLAALGPDELRRHLPKGLLDILEASARISDSELARLAISVHGVQVLRTYRHSLNRAGFAPPPQFAGTAGALRFVESLGFPAEYAGFRSEQRDPLLFAEGRPNLPPLHPFQMTAAGRIQKLFQPGSENRGLLSLPTGAGKTRVTIEALITGLTAAAIASPILWIAETDELCEQAVQAWSQAWRALGPPEKLSIGRLWSSNAVPDADGGPQVVVATIAKIDASVIDAAQYRWLSEAGAVVIDEAHRSTGQQYTRARRWLGLTGKRGRCPLIGLTATPFRGRSQSETERLVSMYGNTRLDEFATDDPYKHLQAMGVLAQVEHRLLEGVDVELSDDELDYLERLNKLPASVEARIGESRDRNDEIIRSIHDLPGDWTVLLFAASVDHAEVMAGLLSHGGIEARAISSETPKAIRRHYIEEFRGSGGLRVLTNYGVLTEGFDAPAVRAVFVTRPTYSPNVYQQMIGRGLRGPKNGGKDECLIVNVADNLARFGERLAFREFESLWS